MTILTIDDSPYICSIGTVVNRGHELKIFSTIEYAYYSNAYATSIR